MEEILHKSGSETESEVKERSSRFLKIFKYIILLTILLAVFGAAGRWVVWPEFKIWRQGRTLADAYRYEQEGDYRRAFLMFEQAYRLDPGNLKVHRELAGFLVRFGQREGLAEWEEIVRVTPEDPLNQLGLARAAMQFVDFETARAALDQLQRAGQTGAEYYRLRAGLALVDRNQQALESALTELNRLVPDDPRMKLNLAMARLASPDPALARAARSELVELARNDRVRIRAIVELLSDVARRWPQPKRERLEELQELARTLTPPLGPLSPALRTNDPVERLVAFALRQPSPETEDAGVFLVWLILNGRAAVAFQWRETLPLRIRNSPLVTAPAADAALRVSDWPHLQELLLAGAWGPVPPGVVSGMFALRGATGRGPETARWSAVLESARVSLPALRVLLRLCEAWGWAEESRQVLVMITRSFAGENWAWRGLIGQALARGDADQLWQVYQRWSRAAPGNAVVQAEMAILGALLQRSGTPGPEATAALVREQPSSALAAVAHGLALWRGRQLAAGLALFDGLPAATWSEPRFALANGLMLAEAGRAQESERMLNGVAPERLLPDERLLIEQAHARNRLRLPASEHR